MRPPLTVSPVKAAPGSGGASSGPRLQVVTGGTQTVSSVTFFDNGVLLGAAQLGLGSAWSFTLPPIAGNPQIRRITAMVITQECTTNNSPTNSFLHADPARFVPSNVCASRGY